MIKKLFLSALAGISLAGHLHADQVIEITGATAFRSAAVASINAVFAAGGNFVTAFSNTDDATPTPGATNLTNGFNQIFRGTFSTLPGTTTIRTSWNGSVEGVRALLVPNATNNASYLKESVLTGLVPNATGTGAAQAQRNYNVDVEKADADLAFSDVALASTPLAGNPVTPSGGPVGVIAFTMIGNKTWKDDDGAGGLTNGITSISAQQWRILCELGRQPIGWFKGNTTETTQVYLTGRNDGSGTRALYLAETGYGVSKKVTQYVGHDRSSSTNLPIILKTAAGGGFNFQNQATPTYKSTVWGQDVDGNGGYSSGQDIRSDMAKTTTSTAVWEFVDGDGSDDFDATEDGQVTAPAKLYLLSWLSTADARTARTVTSTLAANASAKILGYNGVILPGLAGDNPPSTLSSADKGLIGSGTYTAWGYEQLFHLNTADQQVVFTQLKSRLNVPATVGSAGLTLGEMQVKRNADGDTVRPGAL